MHRLTDLTEFTMCTTIEQRPLSHCGTNILIMSSLVIMQIPKCVNFD